VSLEAKYQLINLFSFLPQSDVSNFFKVILSIFRGPTPTVTVSNRNRKGS